MKIEILRELNAEREARRPAIVITDTANGEQRLVKAKDIAADPLRAELAKQLRMGKSGNVEVAGKKLFLNVYAPTAKLVIIGAVHISQALAPIARARSCMMLRPRCPGGVSRGSKPRPSSIRCTSTPARRRRT